MSLGRKNLIGHYRLTCSDITLIKPLWYKVVGKLGVIISVYQ